VKDYEQYLRGLRQQLRDAYQQRTLDHKAADRFVADVWRRYHLPEPPG
jgi:predicted nucleic acid-binding Zn ribbon protein